MSMNTRLDQYAVAGNPIGHSKSPLIHKLFAEQTGEQLEYRTMLVEPGGFARAVDEFRRGGGRGLNVTVPFKQDAWVYSEVLSPRAERAKAVNTLVFRKDGTVLGENTDGLGLVRDVTISHRGQVRGRHILLLGAGGAARGVLQPLLAERPAVLVIANRTAAKARELALLFGDLGPVSGCGFAELGDVRFDLIINATSAGLNDTVPPLPDGVIAEQGWCYDMMYGDRPTAFVRWARDHDAAKALDGLGMLVEQAAESFLAWRGVRPDTGPVLAALRGEG
jgi:shikimate dehydrogenase